LPFGFILPLEQLQYQSTDNNGRAIETEMDFLLTEM